MRKTAHYRRASRFRGEEISLGMAIGSCRDNYLEGQFPVFEFKEGFDCIVAAHHESQGREFVHLVTYEEGAGAAVIETLQTASVDEEPAPQQKEYIQSQVFLICSGSDVIWSSHNAPTRDSAVNVMVNQLVSQFSGVDDAPFYGLEATLDEARFRELMQQGIEEIDLAVGGYRETLEYVLANGEIERGGLFSVLTSLLPGHVSPEEREAAEDVMARFTLRPGRSWDKPHVKELMADMASEVLDGFDDGFTIVTKNGLRITKDYMRVKEDFSVDGNRRIINVGQMRTALHNAFDEFSRLGVLER